MAAITEALSLTAEGDEPSTFPFLSLHAELRYMVYHHVFAQRSIIIRDHLTPSYSCGRRYWHYHLDDPHDTSDSAISLLQVCKHIFQEARPIFAIHVPSHLILSQDLHTIPQTYHVGELETQLGVPISHITQLYFNVKNLGDNQKSPKQCPGSPGNPFVLNYTFPRDSFLWELNDPPPDPLRLPNLDGIRQFRNFCITSLSSLREIHIYDILKDSLSQQPDPCVCPTAGSETCTCGQCACSCLSHPPLPLERGLSHSDVEAGIHNALISRYRAALPVKEKNSGFLSTDFSTVIKLLHSGIHVYLHDNVSISIPLGPRQSLWKGSWHATYHLCPAEDAIKPGSPPKELPESPRQRQLNQMAERSGKTKSRPAEAHGKRVDELFDAQQNFDFDSYLRSEIDGDEIPEELKGRSIVEWEAGLKLKITDDSSFDSVFEQDTDVDLSRAPAQRPKSLWEWN